VQGTGAVALAGILTALRAQGKPAKDIAKQRIVCLGGGSAGLGVVNSLIDGMVEEGLPREARFSFFSSLFYYQIIIIIIIIIIIMSGKIVRACVRACRWRIRTCGWWTRTV
jgi:malic enzyme